MFYTISRLQSRVIGFFLLMLLVASATGCVSGRPSGTAVTDTSELGGEKLITEISAREEGETATVTIHGNAPLNFTSVKQTLPLSIVLYFPQASFQGTKSGYSIGGTLVNRIETYQQDHAARVRLVLNADSDYTVEKDGNNLEIVLKPRGTTGEMDTGMEEKNPEGAGVVEPSGAPDTGLKLTEAPETLDAATRITEVTSAVGADSVVISLKGDGIVRNFKPFTIEAAHEVDARIVFDIFKVKSAAKGEQVVPVNALGVKSVRYFSYPERMRLVIDTVDENLKKFHAVPVRDGLQIVVGKGALASADDKKRASTAPSPQKPAWVNKIDFLSEAEGRSTLVIGTTRPVEYQVSKKDDKTLHLRLSGTKISKKRQFPLITTRFDSAVNRVLPIHTKAMKERSLFVIELREAVPYFLDQTDNELRMRFEASSVPPRPEEEVDLPDWKATLSRIAEEEVEAVPAEVAEVVPPKLPDLEKEAVAEEEIVTPRLGKVYTGEKITVDFFDADIKNVLRTIRGVSGENFAIDKDVTGKVTMTLEHPAPWDQILDLVLRMNSLGMTKEDGINRIATLETLRAEEEKRLALMTAEDKAKQKVKALEPLETAYIVINYSDAEKDIKPHLEPNLTPDRGILSVDKRTNQIILTDTADKIAQARSLVAKIDRITPQVIIEARIVEASDNFKRAIGSFWGAQSGPDGLHDGRYSYNVVMNNAVDTTTTIGFGITTGNSLILNATLTAQETQKEVKIISSPKVLTLDNKKATIKQGVEFPYQVVEDGDVEISFKQIELKLEVTPHVTADNRVSMQIVIDKNDIAGFTEGIPNLTTKNVETELLVNDGETIVIGGIIKSNFTLSEQAFPLLSKIPILGWLFKNKIKTDDKEELLVFITPRIVKLEELRI